MSQTLVGVKLRQKEYILIKKIFGLSFPLIRTLKNVGKNLEKWSFFFQKPGNSLEF